MIIKRLNTSREVVAGLHLVWDVFIRENAGSCTQQGIEEFARFIKMENFMPLVERGEMIVFGVVEGQELGGIGAVQSDGHISLLFVRPDLRRRGIAKALVNEMCRFCTMQLALMRITVNASVVSTEAYHHMGFRDLAPVQEKDGIRFVPMELMVSPANVRPSHYGKKHTGLFIGIAVTAVIFLIFLGLLFGKIIINFTEIFNRFNILKLLPVRGGVSAEIIDFDFSCSSRTNAVKARICIGFCRESVGCVFIGYASNAAHVPDAAVEAIRERTAAKLGSGFVVNCSIISKTAEKLFGAHIAVAIAVFQRSARYIHDANAVTPYYAALFRDLVFSDHRSEIQAGFNFAIIVGVYSACRGGTLERAGIIAILYDAILFIEVNNTCAGCAFY